MSVVGDIKAGLKTRLETISGVRVYANPHDMISQFPAAVIFTDSLQYPITFAGTAMAGTMRVVFLSDSAVTEQAVRDLDKYLHPSNGSSVLRAIYGDGKLGTAVDGVVSVSAENIGVRQLGNGDTAIGADFVVSFLRK